jgi:OOP family OmpA-OmpF porin
LLAAGLLDAGDGDPAMRARARAEARTTGRGAAAAGPCARSGARACSGARTSGAAHNAGCEGAVRLRQGRAEAEAAIDSEIISKLRNVQKLELVLVTGHTDRIGTQRYNQRLSERRADAVRDYLVSRGVPRDKIETLGMGKTQPVPGVVCNQKALKALIACLAPNRRVEIEVKGEGVAR